MARYVALLRGINVGGINLIRMPDLRACFEAQGFQDVTTYIQSGNVVFTSRQSAQAALTRSIESAISEAFHYDASVILRSGAQLKKIVSAAPHGFGSQPGQYRYDVLFLKEPLHGTTALAEVPVRDGVDEAWAGAGVIYFSRLISKAAQSRLSRVASLPVYKQMTIRNWNTTTKLLTLLESPGQ